MIEVTARLTAGPFCYRLAIKPVFIVTAAFAPQRRFNYANRHRLRCLGQYSSRFAEGAVYCTEYSGTVYCVFRAF